MRVIAGTYRSRLLSAPPGTSTRPTSDRLRETMFNILGPRIAGCRFVDLYAGTGAVGIEAVSRGAAHVWFAESSAPALKALRANLATLKVPATSSTVEDRGTASLLARLRKLRLTVDLVFLDPPYEAENYYTETLAELGRTAEDPLLAPDAMVIVEYATRGKFKLAEKYGSLLQTRTYKQGDTSLAFYSAGAAVPAEAPAEVPEGNAPPV